MKLVIGNKNYSSWSLRPWLAMSVAGIAFEEDLVPLDQPDTRTRLLARSPAAKVPILIDGDVTVWESLAILEYLAERFPDAGLWPADPAARAHARAISSEMHAGFSALRSACPMNLRKRFGWRDRGAEVTRDVARVQQLWSDCRRRFGHDGPFLFGDFTAADAMYAPVVARFDGYSIPVDEEAGAYMAAVMDLPAFRAWKAAGIVEPWVLDIDEVDEPAIAEAR
ncbi:glutathione S-transferase [Tepidamorphus gemmatus]|uniref:Glutathione S-transferase n=1 Tax=Tepidamorphus gemmatus TaxID=747076 RepID=A0A4R3MA99_9HYPH|nr:glutathione S-transferase family protein [Tepidamorphus gemmatus]TCT08335.1 glutathione S-transferase [Tepidamorphus gemmatus]